MENVQAGNVVVSPSAQQVDKYIDIYLCFFLDELLSSPGCLLFFVITGLNSEERHQVSEGSFL